MKRCGITLVLLLLTGCASRSTIVQYAGSDGFAVPSKAFEEFLTDHVTNCLPHSNPSGDVKVHVTVFHGCRTMQFLYAQPHVVTNTSTAFDLLVQEEGKIIGLMPSGECYFWFDFPKPKAHESPNKVPEDTARKLADPRH